MINKMNMNAIKYVIIISALLQAGLLQAVFAGSQTGRNYDPKTDFFYAGCGSSNKIKSFESTNMTPALFNWQMVQIPPPFNYFIADIFFVDSSYGWATHGNGGILKTTNSGFNWVHTEIIPGGGGCICGVYFINKDTGWICGVGSYIRKTTNGGENWITQVYPPFAGPYYYSVQFIDYNTGYITGSANALRGYIIKTTNSGENWQQIFLSVQNNTDIFGQFWFNVDTGWVYGKNIFMKTTNGGSTFQDYYPNLPPTSNGSNGLLGLFFANTQTGWLSGSNVDHKNMHKTTNGGENWVFQDNPVTQYQFAQLDDVLFIDENRGWAGSYAGQIITTTNGGFNWITDLSAPDWFYCFANYGAVKVWCGTGNGRVWYLDDIPPIGIQQISGEIAENFYLYQNYPNPFNPVTTIKYEIPNDAGVTIKIYDLLGKEIFIFNEFKKAGRYELNFDGSKFSSGIYIYELHSGYFSDSKKMVLLK